MHSHTRRLLLSLTLTPSLLLLTPDEACAAPPDAEHPDTVVAKPTPGAPEKKVEVFAPASRSNAPWVGLELGGTPYDVRRSEYLARFDAAVQAGHRWESFGVFGHLQYDQTRVFTQQTPSLRLVNLGIGADWINYLGRLRSSVVVGTSTLLTKTAIDPAGTTGWFADVRPAILRWPFGDVVAVQLTPLSFNVDVPVTQGIPLVLTAYFTLIGIEWSLQ